MALPVNKRTLGTALLISVLIAATLPFYPILAMTFEAGLIVGLLLHSSHVAENVECGNLDQKA